MRLSILDDYQGVALRCADWETLPHGTAVEAFREHLTDENAPFSFGWVFGLVKKETKLLRDIFVGAFALALRPRLRAGTRAARRRRPTRVWARPAPGPGSPAPAACDVDAARGLASASCSLRLPGPQAAVRAHPMARLALRTRGHVDFDAHVAPSGRYAERHELERARGGTRHLVDGKLERQQAKLPDIMADHARKCAVEARMRHALTYGAVGRDAVAVGADERNTRRQPMGGKAVGQHDGEADHPPCG